LSLESFFNHHLLIWEYLVLILVIGVGRVIFLMLWTRGKKKGREEYDDYKKWESRFKEEGRLDKK